MLAIIAILSDIPLYLSAVFARFREILLPDL